MTNIEKYNNAFVEVFAVNAANLDENFSKATVKEWDSVHQLSLVAMLEDSFDIMFDPEDIMELTSYAAGRTLLTKYDIQFS